MKDRIDTKNSIMRKSRAILKARKRRRMICISASACAAICVISVGITSIYRAGLSKKAEADLDGAAYKHAGAGEYEDELGIASDEYGVFLARGAEMPDGLRIYTVPESEEINLSAENENNAGYISEMEMWLSGLDTENAESVKGACEEKTYVIERRYGNEISVSYICGNKIKTDGGEWMKLSDEQRAEFEKILNQISK